MKIFVNSWDCQRLQSSGIATHSTAECSKTEALNIINATEKLSCRPASIITTAKACVPGTRDTVITDDSKKCHKTAKSVICQ